ncbi:PREDICTED: serum paraoxonase/arylesterase 1-like [Acropora digitifera]|uniref:serum paraoxonase/arylesterase 1-like n=1 Tax=Acropora digitifera TaxID=70779 RepID=UPI00077ACBC4|nr:PREDICTED: serum paraoxonase/arylesterase 1-like [Acropora digitifera]
MGRFGEFAAVAVVAVFVYHCLTILINAGAFTHTVNHSPGPCRPIKVNGSEDLALLPDGLVFISSVLRYKLPFSYDAELDKRDSKLLTFDFAKPDQDPIEVTLKNFNRTGFNPHGITVYQDPSSNRVSLFVINHRLDSQAIEIFDLERASHSLVHRRSVVDPLIWSPNNLYAVGPNSFYVTNDNFFHFESTVLRQVATFFLNYWLHGSVVFFDGVRGFEVAQGHPNGISMDKSERFVIVPNTLSRSVVVYRRRHDNSLEETQTIKVGSLIDNVNVDPVTGNLWLAGIPRVSDIVEHINNISHRSPSQIMMLQLGEPASSGIGFPDYQLREAYMDDGRQITGATSAVVYKDRLLIGSICGNLLLCEIQYF